MRKGTEMQEMLMVSDMFKNPFCQSEHCFHPPRVWCENWHGHTNQSCVNICVGLFLNAVSNKGSFYSEDVVGGCVSSVTEVIKLNSFFQS